MTSAVSGGDSLSRTADRDRAIAEEARAEIARQKPRTKVSQKEIAFAVFGESQQWLSRRLNGEVAFSPGEIIALADYLKVDVNKFLGAGKGTPPGQAEPTVTELAEYADPWTLIIGDGESSAPVRDHLRALASAS